MTRKHRICSKLTKPTVVAFGTILCSLVFAFTALAQETSADDPATGLIYLHKRYYDPNLGRFVSSDLKMPGQNIGTNRYEYGANAPGIFVDTDGMLFRLVGKRLSYMTKLMGKLWLNIRTFSPAKATFMNEQGVKQLLTNKDIVGADRKLLQDHYRACSCAVGRLKGVQDTFLRQADIRDEMHYVEPGTPRYVELEQELAQVTNDHLEHVQSFPKDLDNAINTWNDVRTKGGKTLQDSFQAIHTDDQWKQGIDLYEPPKPGGVTGGTLAVALTPGLTKGTDWSDLGNWAKGATQDFVADAIWDAIPGTGFVDAIEWTGFKLPRSEFNVPNVYPTNGRPWEVPGCDPAPHVPC